MRWGEWGGSPSREDSCAAAERSGPGALTHLTNSMFLQALAGTRRVLGAAAWATCTLLGSRADNRFPLSVRVHSGEEVVLSVVRHTHSWPTVLAAHSAACLAAGCPRHACLAAVMLIACGPLCLLAGTGQTGGQKGVLWGSAVRIDRDAEWGVSASEVAKPRLLRRRGA